MKEYFIDTNIFLRFLLADSPRQYNLARQIFLKAEKGKISLWTSTAVILELIWTLQSFYKLDRISIQEKISSLMVLEGLKVENSDLLLSALDLFTKKNVDFIDAYNFCLARKMGKKIISFDKDFDKLGERENLSEIVQEK